MDGVLITKAYGTEADGTTPVVSSGDLNKAITSMRLHDEGTQAHIEYFLATIQGAPAG